MRTDVHTQQQPAKTTRGPRRELAIDNFSQAPASSVWYYRVNVSLYEEVLVSTFIGENGSDDSSSEEERSSGSSQPTLGVKHYSILRRYSDFRKLHEHIRVAVIAAGEDQNSLPSFPGKEFVSPIVRNLLWCASSSEVLLKDRSAKFEELLQWIENHPIARKCRAFAEFIGKPPQSHDGYVSLKEYTPSDWLSSLQQATTSMESRRRRFSTGSSTFRSWREPEALSTLTSSHCLAMVTQISSMRSATMAPCEIDGRYSA
ncbi:hypothetical protein ON010_g8876 [Phytophthora cinnamomi]|nr:hypothetical protein ON010_g8876 [Phytophthora cinnamomi]